MKYDVIVVGGGHAGTEASLASARMGLSTLLVTMSKGTIGIMSCNPAIGGVGKGQLVKEIDALGGEMGKAADFGGIQFRQLNASKGMAARSSRAQEDRKLYRSYIQEVIKAQRSLSVLEDKVLDIILDGGAAKGVATESNGIIPAKAVIITAGTFMNGLIHIGLTHFPGGRIGEEAISGLSQGLKSKGIKIMRFKTGTCARIDGRSIDFSELVMQQGDPVPVPFSFSTKKIRNKQIPCAITYTNERTHDIIRAGLTRSPLYTGVIRSTGVRYCPSIEDKIVRFSDRTRHQVFLEPEGLDTNEYYPNGLSTSLPEDIQLEFLRSIKGLEHVEVIKWGYGIEYDLIDPTGLYPTLEHKNIANLYFAGQVNGTTGYEEAAAQGLIAGINASLKVRGQGAFIVDRSTSYIGVLIDDLVTKGTGEPYRMFTSRVEYRLLIREDNADIRLRESGFKLGLVSKEEYEQTKQKERAIKGAISALRKGKVENASDINPKLKSLKLAPAKKGLSVLELLKRPGITYHLLKELSLAAKDMPAEVERQIENEIKYDGYIQKQLREVKQFKHLERIRLPEDIDYADVNGLSTEIREKLARVRPVSLGQASRISGVTPVAITILMVHLKAK